MSKGPKAWDHEIPLLCADRLTIVVNILLHVYAVHMMPLSSKSDPEAPHANGHIGNGSIRLDDRVRDAEEYELHGLTESDDEGDEAEALVKKEARRAER